MSAPASRSVWIMACDPELAAIWRGVWPLVSYFLLIWILMGPWSSPLVLVTSPASTAAWRGNLWALRCRGSGAMSQPTISLGINSNPHINNNLCVRIWTPGYMRSLRLGLQPVQNADTKCSVQDSSINNFPCFLLSCSGCCCLCA